MITNRLLTSNSTFLKLPFSDFVYSTEKVGINEIDLALAAPHVYIDSKECLDISGIREYRRSGRLTVKSASVCAYRYSICADSSTMQGKKSLEYYKRCIEFASLVGADMLQINASGACFDYEKDRLLSNAARMLNQLVITAKNQNVVLLLGTVLGKESDRNQTTPVLTGLNDIKAMIGYIDNIFLDAYLDTEAVYVAGESISDWVHALGTKVRLIRFADGNYNGYRIWGDGCLPVNKMMNEIKENMYMGYLSTALPGEYYLASPEIPFAKNIAALQEVMGI